MSLKGTLAVVGPNPTFGSRTDAVAWVNEGQVVVIISDGVDYDEDYLVRTSKDEGYHRGWINQRFLRLSVVLLTKKEIHEFTGVPVGTRL